MNLPPRRVAGKPQYGQQSSVRNEQASSNSNDWNTSQLSVAFGNLVGEVATNSEQVGSFGDGEGGADRIGRAVLTAQEGQRLLITQRHGLKHNIAFTIRQSLNNQLRNSGHGST